LVAHAFENSRQSSSVAIVAFYLYLLFNVKGVASSTCIIIFLFHRSSSCDF
jgi:hypothetical protein